MAEKNSENVLEIENLSVVFDTGEKKISAVRNLSLQVKRGEIFAVVGESGCGKSVMCRTVMGLLHATGRVTEGSIKIKGKELIGLTDDEYCSIRGNEAAMVFQDPMTSLDPTYTIGSQIGEAVRAHDKRISEADVKSRVIELMELVGIDRANERYDVRPWMLSGGMRQRCVLAMALANDPALLIADEPTTALDATVQAEILDILADIRDKTGMGILFITHDLGVVARVADRIAVMYAGKIIETGMAQEIYDHPAHPYTWGLMHALPAYAYDGRLHPIPGAPPLLEEGFKGDAFAERNPFALDIDFVEEPPFFDLTQTHKVASWLYSENSEQAKMQLQKMHSHTHEHHSMHKLPRVKSNGRADVLALSDGSGSVAEEEKASLLQVRDLAKDFRLGRKNVVHAVRDVSFDIRQGEVFALVGESGSGKSTLARCILGLYGPTAGNISFDDTVMKKSDVQFISQDSSSALNQKMTVRDIIAEPFEINKVFKDKTELDARIGQLLDEVGIDRSFMYRYPPELSGGQRQRVSIARAYGMKPRLLVADEPLASLDVSVQAQIIELFADLMKSSNMSMLFIAHDLSMVEFLSDRVGVMYHGRMVELAQTKQLFADPRHPYTKALLSAVPVPDPSYEKGRVIDKFRADEEALCDSWWTEVSSGHFVLMPGQDDVLYTVKPDRDHSKQHECMKGGPGIV